MDSSTPPHKPAEKPAASPRTILAVLMVGTFLAPLDSSIVNIALPSIAESLSASLTGVSWVADAYLLAVATLLLSMGRLGDLWGLRNLYVWGLVIFAVGSLACSLSSALWMLIAARAFQAVGASMLFAAGPAVVARTFPPDKRGAALGVVSLSVAAGLTVGPALGGVLVGAAGWPSIFYINVPIALIAAPIAWRVLSTQPPVAEDFDVPGAILGGAGLLAFIGALTEMDSRQFGGAAVGGALISAVLIGGLFVWWERRAKHPMLDLRLLESRQLSAGLLSALLAYSAMFSVVLTMPFLLLKAQGLSPSQAGLLLSVQPLAMAVFAPYAGRLSDRIGSRVPSTLGLCLQAAGLVALSMLGAASPLWQIAACLLVVGSGMAIFQTPNTASVLRATPRARHGVGSALIAEARNVGMAVGIAATAAIIAWKMGPTVDALGRPGMLAPEEAAKLVTGMATALRVAAVAAAIAAALSWPFRDDVTPEVERGEQGR
jgi:EmrB/QacA subfamily drug resistance transporter